MGRRRRRKLALEAESLQGELLGESSAPSLAPAPPALASSTTADASPAQAAVSTEARPRVEPPTAASSLPAIVESGTAKFAPVVSQPSTESAPAPTTSLSDLSDLVPPPPELRIRKEPPRSSASARGMKLANASVGTATKRDDETAATSRDRHESARDHASARPAGEPLVRARSLVEQGRVQEAIQLYLGILTVNPENLKARNNLGVLYDELKQFGAARDQLEAAARLEPENVEVLTNLASTLTSLARYDEAEALIRRAQKVDADDNRVHLALGILYFRRGLYAQAETDLRWVCARDRESGSAFYYRGEALNRLGRYDEAVQALERAAELMPNDPKPVYTLGHLYDRRHQPEEAAEMYRRARRLQSR